MVNTKCKKDGFPTELDARIRMSTIDLNDKGHRHMAERTKRPRRSYACPKCKLYHLTHLE